MKTAISIPNDLFQAAEETARRLGLNRSELYQRAMAEYLHHHGDAGITDALNTLYGTEASSMDPVLGHRYSSWIGTMGNSLSAGRGD